MKNVILENLQEKFITAEKVKKNSLILMINSRRIPESSYEIKKNYEAETQEEIIIFEKISKKIGKIDFKGSKDYHCIKLSNAKKIKNVFVNDKEIEAKYYKLFNDVVTISGYGLFSRDIVRVEFLTKTSINSQIIFDEAPVRGDCVEVYYNY